MGRKSKKRKHSKARKGKSQQTKSKKTKKTQRVRKWIAEMDMKRGALSKQLKIPIKENIPKTLLKEIKGAKTGTTVKNPTKTGKRNIKVTPTIKKRATLALTLKAMKK